jgi:hypothetical protein
MAIETAGQKAAKATKIRIENASTISLPKDTEATIRKVLDYLPTEQIRAFGFVVENAVPQPLAPALPEQVVIGATEHDVANENNDE